MVEFELDYKFLQDSVEKDDTNMFLKDQFDHSVENELVDITKKTCGTDNQKAICQGMNVCVPHTQKHMLKASFPHCDGIWRWELGGVIKFE